MKYIRAPFSILFGLSFYQIAVGSDERDLSAPTQTAPQEVGFGSDRYCGVDKVSRGPRYGGLR